MIELNANIYEGKNMRVFLSILGITFFIPFLAVMLAYLVLGLLIAIIFSIAECFIKDDQCHGRNNLERFERLVNSFLEAFKEYFLTMFAGRR